MAEGLNISVKRDSLTNISQIRDEIQGGLKHFGGDYYEDMVSRILDEPGMRDHLTESGMDENTFGNMTLIIPNCLKGIRLKTG